MRPTTVKEWRRLVFASEAEEMTAATKVLCLYLADHMSADRKVSLHRDVIAEALGIDPARVTERVGRATAAGFLTRPRRGDSYTGKPNEYQALRPDNIVSKRYPQNGDQSGAESRREVPAKRDTFGVRSTGTSRNHKPTDTGGLVPALQDAYVEEPSREGADRKDPAPESAPDEPSSTGRVEKQLRSNKKSPTDQVSVSTHVCAWHGEEFPCADDCPHPRPMPDRKERA